MNCNDVFDALTNPADCHAADLQAHLAACPRCRQLQQVLEPALSLLSGDLPVERGKAVESPDEMPSFNEQAAHLSRETVGMAEAIAAQLATASGGQRVPPRRPVGTRRVIVAALRSVALVLFGALAVYCMAPRGGETDAPALPAVLPPSGPAKLCTRLDLQRKDQGRRDARRVVLSCVACHMNDDPSRRPGASTSLIWPRRLSGVPMSLASAPARAKSAKLDANRDECRQFS